MKYIKLYEDFDDEPHIGDYVICKDELFDGCRKKDEIDFINFLKDNVGHIVNIDNEQYGKYKYLVKYENIPQSISHFFELYHQGTNSLRPFSKGEILRKATPEEIEGIKIKRNINKYNL